MNGTRQDDRAAIEFTAPPERLGPSGAGRVKPVAGEQREEDADRRDSAAGVRDDVAGRRDLDAARRDAQAERRDGSAVIRDDAAEARDGVADVRDADGVRRDGDAERRDVGAARRDLTGVRRDDAGGTRDVAADARDETAFQRDQAADQRDRLADQRDRDSMANLDRWDGVGAGDVVATTRSHRLTAASERRRAHDDRIQAAADRGVAAQDRASALADRVAGASTRESSEGDRGTALADRDTALADRAAGAEERSFASVDRGIGLADRDTALADRVADASTRGLAGVDRGTALTDRAAAAADRESFMEYAVLQGKMVESEARAWRLLQAAPDPVIVSDADGIIELVNVQAVALFGYQPEELIGQPVERLVPVGLRDVHRAHRGAYVAADEPLPMSTGPDIIAVRKDGGLVPVEVNISAITLATGRAVLASIRDVSDRKLAEAELRISDERFKVSFDSAPIGMSLIDLHPENTGRFLRVNRALRELTGYDEQHLLATTSPAITHPADREDTSTNLQRLVDGNATRWDTDLRYRTASGDDIWVHFAISVVHETDGRPSYGVSQVEDITDRKSTEAQLVERFHELADNVDVGFLIRQIDPPAYLYANPAFLRMFGFDPSGPAPTPSDLAASFDPQDAQPVRPLLAGAPPAEPFEPVWRFTLPDGGLRWASEHVSPITDEDGQIRRHAVLIEDITDRRATEAALRESEQRFDQLARNTEVGFWLRGRDSHELLYMNPALPRIFGLDPAQQQPSFDDLAAMIHPDDQDDNNALIAATGRGERTAGNFRIVRPDGVVRLIAVHNDPVVTSDGEDRVAATVTDITDRKLAEEQMATARMQADRANAGKDDFLSRMSHELRTPLNAILGFAQLLQLSELTAEQSEGARQIRQAGEHLLTLVDEVLDVTAIDSGSLRLSMEPVSVRDVADEAVAMLRPLAARGEISISVEPDGLDVYVRADHQRLKQVVVNLLANAIKYNRPGGQVGFGVHDGDRGVRVEVSDTGIGIAEADLDRLFQPFERFAADRAQVEGTGLGLALSKRLTTAMGGTIGATSRLGEGSVFWVELPRASPASPDLAVTHSHALGPAPRGEARTVLYVEDNMSNVRLVERILAYRPDVALHIALTGHHGLQLALEVQPDLVLLDLHLPDLSGEEVLGALRADPRTARTPVAVISGDAMPASAARLLPAGATTYMTKPLDISRLLALIDDLTSSPATRDAAESKPVAPQPSSPPALQETKDRGPVPTSIAEVAHDLNNQIGVILNYCALLSRNCDATAAGDLETIKSAAKAVAALVAEHLASSAVIHTTADPR